MASQITFHLALLVILLNCRVFVTAESLESDFTNNLVAGLTP